MPDPVISPQPDRPFLDVEAKLTPESRDWTFDVTNFQTIFGNGSPEGVIEAVIGRYYRDEANTRAGADIWVKRTAAIGGDNKLGWVIVSGLSGNAEKTVETAVDVTVVPGNEIINCSAVLNVTFIDIADAVDEITITATNGIVTMIADATIQFGNTVASLSSITLYPASGQWWQKN